MGKQDPGRDAFINLNNSTWRLPDSEVGSAETLCQSMCGMSDLSMSDVQLELDEDAHCPKQPDEPTPL